MIPDDLSGRCYMQILEINFKAVFENLPGKNVLLLPNPPFFTIAAMSNAYSKAVSMKRKEARGKNISELFSDHGVEPGSIKDLLDSLEHVVHHKEPHSIILWELNNYIKNTSGKKQLKVLHTPILSPSGEVQYIIQNISAIADIKPSSIKKRQEQPDNNPGIPEVNSFESVVMQSPVAMAILKGGNLIIESANLHMLDLLGKDKTIVGHSIVEALPEIVNQPFPQLLKNVYKTGLEYHGFETKIYINREEELTECYFNFVYSPLKDQKGGVTGVMMIATDVTTLVVAKKALEESEKRYRDLIASANVATSIYAGENMEIRLANNAMLKVWGKDASVIGKPLKEAVPELDGQPFFGLLHKVYSTGETYHATEDKVDLAVDGRLQSFYFNFTYKALRDSTGRIYGILNMAVDVSEMVRAKLKIKDAEERWRIALNSAGLGTWDFYPHKNEFVCSVRTKELFGLSSNAPVTLEKLMNAIHYPHRKKVYDKMEKAMKQGSRGNYRIEYQLTGIEDKKQRWHRATGQVFFNDEGVVHRLNGTVLDITDRKRVEEALEERVQLRTIELLNANKELERSNQELEQYAYVASHDLQEPLRKILVYSDLIKNGLSKSNTDAIRLEKIVGSAQRMSHLIQDLLNFSRLLKTENIFSTVDLNHILRNVIDDFELKIQETGAVIHIDELPELEASPQQMNQLFYNLISNALKFKKQAQTPIIEVKASILTKVQSEIFPDLDSSVPYCDITVRDNGIGFNVKHVKHIFEIFKRLHTRSKFEGTGIGLALCRKIARNHCGEIYAESREGEGSVFHVLLPLHQKPI